MNPDDSPAEGIPVVVSPGGVRGSTASNGMARLTINTQATDARLEINVSRQDNQNINNIMKYVF